MAPTLPLAVRPVAQALEALAGDRALGHVLSTGQAAHRLLFEFLSESSSRLHVPASGEFRASRLAARSQGVAPAIVLRSQGYGR